MLKENPKIIIPNFFTSMNMLVGFAAVYFAMGGEYEKSAWLILFSVLMDKIDGTTARVFHATSDFGVEFDSFSDFFSFGVAPAMLIFCHFLNLNNGNLDSVPFYIKGGCAVYVLFAAIRLAKFNVMGKDDHEYFAGLTSTQSGLMLASFYLLSMKYDLPILRDENIISGMLFAHSFLMIANFKYPKIKKSKKRWMNIVQMLAFMILIILVIFRRMPEAIYIVNVLYLLVGVIYTRFYDKKISVDDAEKEVATGH